MSSARRFPSGSTSSLAGPRHQARGAGVLGGLSAERQPLWLRLREPILTAGKIAIEETTAPVLDPDRSRTKSDSSGLSRAMTGPEVRPIRQRLCCILGDEAIRRRVLPALR
jgi:hypothetical protein